MDTITLLERQWAPFADEVGWPELGWPTLTDARLAATTDAAVATLLRLHQAGDLLAGVVLVTALAPALVGRAVLMGVEPGDCVTPLWWRLGSHRLAARSRHLRAALVLDAVRDAARTRAAVERSVPLAEPLPAWEPDPDDDPSGPTVLRRGARLGLISPLVHDTLRAVYVDGMTSREVARAWDVDDATVRQRCRRGVRQLAAARDMLLVA